jgi:protein-S-isoprenylcysteine O-methyltransferase Ste14
MFTRIVIAAGALLVFLGAGLRTWGAAYLRTEVVHDTAQHSEALVADGPFRHTRNPLYLANLPMAAGIGVLAVARFWPALKPRVPLGNLRPDWGQAFAGESFVWLFDLAELLIAATLNPWFGIVTFLLAFVAHFLVTRQIQKQRSA